MLLRANGSKMFKDAYDAMNIMWLCVLFGMLSKQRQMHCVNIKNLLTSIFEIGSSLNSKITRYMIHSNQNSTVS